MHKQGQILLCKDFRFKDGPILDKLFVVLDTATTDCSCLVIITTSNPSRYAYAISGCNSIKSCFYIPVDCKQDFSEDTYIQLPRIFELNIDDLLSKRELSFIGHISDRCFTQLKGCLRKFKYDISSQYWARIYQAT
jgi:hypothetical protein